MNVADSNVPGASFSDLVKADKQIQVKYDRPANLKDFVDNKRLYESGIAAGGRLQEDGTLQMAGLRDDQGNPITIQNEAGQTILSMSKPGVTAIAPRNFQEFMGDVKRAFTGYNTLSFDPNSRTSQNPMGSRIQRNEGILSNLSPLSFIPGANALVQGVNTFRNIFFPPPPTVTYGGEVTGTVVEEPLDKGVVSALPNEFTTIIKDKPELPTGDRLNAMNLFDDFINLPTTRPDLYG